ncbi:hypothetical protein GH714_024227 [Hevea brasiliensis]|uniref:Uncharacterized protein n=1 Tax=Hevea brasiliensis TaxID=3981 RepID=A0A6A6KJB3_HEVBR|nr:hypothetical protein GH714_024227 [Hevea brasiliensis]
MDPESKKFERGPRELTGAVDLISHYKLLPHHEFFCKRSLPLSISDTHYLYNVVGDTEIRKGEGMQLDQLIQNTSYSRDSNTCIQPFDLDVLQEAFQFKETTPIDLPPITLVEVRDFVFIYLSPYHLLQAEKGLLQLLQNQKKRKHDGDEYVNDGHKHKKSKHKSSKIDEIGAIKVAG